MHSACTQCRRVFCRQHIASRAGQCFRCVERCTSRSCEREATKSCRRCRRGLCVSHRTSGERRCGRCEGDYERDVASEVQRRKSEDGREALGAILKLAALAVFTVVLGEFDALFLPPGIAATYLLGGYLASPPEPVRTQERRRFLAENNF